MCPPWSVCGLEPPGTLIRPSPLSLRSLLPVHELSKSTVFNPTISYFDCGSHKLFGLHSGSSSYLDDFRKEWFLGSENKRN